MEVPHVRGPEVHLRERRLEEVGAEAVAVEVTTKPRRARDAGDNVGGAKGIDDVETAVGDNQVDEEEDPSEQGLGHLRGRDEKEPCADAALGDKAGQVIEDAVLEHVQSTKAAPLGCPMCQLRYS